MEPKHTHRLPKGALIVTALVVIGVGYLFTTNRHVATKQPATEESLATPWPSTEIRQEKIDDNSKGYTATIVYPVTRDASINQTIKQFVDDQVAQFESDTAWVHDAQISSAAKDSLSIDIRYTNERAAHAETYVFSIATYTGGAHPLSVTKTFSYRDNGEAITLKDLFSDETKGLAQVSQYAIKQVTEMNVSDAAWIADGAGPTEDNYRSFVVTDSGVSFIFDPYQVAPYVQGAVRIDVPVSAFALFANKALFTR